MDFMTDASEQARVAIEALPRVRLGTLPTPLVPLDRLSSELGVEVWAKRDDLTGLGFGGNKVRQLEFLVADALARRANVLVTGGGPRSNHVRITAAAAARSGLDCRVVLYGEPPVPEPANLSWTRRFGARVSYTGSAQRASVDETMSQLCEELSGRGQAPYMIERGAGGPLGCVGYLRAAIELDAQLDDIELKPKELFLATGSCGTQAGLVLGLGLTRPGCRVVGVTTSRPRAECLRRVDSLVQGCAALLEIDAPTTSCSVTVIDGIGPGYGICSAGGLAATRLLAATEGLALDQTFTAKAMAELVVRARRGRCEEPIVFLHSGGAGGALSGSVEDGAAA